MEYGTKEELINVLLYKKIVEWDEDKLLLEDGSTVTIEMSDSDCCAWAGGMFSSVELDAVITDVIIGEPNNYYDDDTNNSEVKVVLYHNHNPIAQADCHADAGNGGYYYSVGSFVVNGIHYPIVRA